MDEELREKIVRDLLKNYHKRTAIEQADAIIVITAKAGYRKISGEPPVLSEEEIVACVKAGYEAHEFDIDLAIDKRIAQAQRDADVRFYNGNH